MAKLVTEYIEANLHMMDRNKTHATYAISSAIANGHQGFLVKLIHNIASNTMNNKAQIVKNHRIGSTYKLRRTTQDEEFTRIHALFSKRYSVISGQPKRSEISRSLIAICYLQPIPLQLNSKSSVAAQRV